MSDASTRLALLAAVLLAGGGLAGAVTGGTVGLSAAGAGESVPSGPLTTVAVGPNGTVEGPAVAVGPRAVVAGTVEGNLRAYAGVVVLTENATVTGDVQAFGGVVRLNGSVGSYVTAYGGRVVVGGSVGNVNAGGGTVRLAGTTGPATVLGGRVVLADGARVRGDLEYDARLVDRGGVVVGDREPTDALLGPVGTLLRAVGAVPRLLPLLAGALAVGVTRLVPEARGVAVRARSRPARSLALGVGVGVAAVVCLALLAVSVVGTPLVGLALPVAGAGALLALGVGQTAGGGAVAARLPVGPVAATAALAVVCALPGVGPPVSAGLAAWGAGALAGGTTLKPLRRGVRPWT